MIYAIFSDIHGNLEALTVAINYVMDLGITKILCCGDTMGYGPNPIECLHFIQKYQCLSVAGNHDKAIVKDSVGIYFNEDAVIALNIQRSNLSLNDIDYLKKLPSKRVFRNFVITHSSLDKRTPFRYITDEASARNSFKNTRKNIIFIGHSHIPSCFIIEKNNFQSLSAKYGLDLDIEKGKRYIINVGSIGQPRDGNPELSLCLFDDISMIVRIVRLPYPVTKTQELMKNMDLPDFLIQRLNHGI
jgi:predicted phosphodiesterase